MKRTERLHAITEMLRRQGSRGSTADRMAAEFGVSVRTIKRDLVSLERSGAALWSRPGPGGGYGLSEAASIRPVSLSPAQAVAILAAVSAAPDAPYSDLASAGMQKILDVLDPATRDRARRLADRVWVDAPPAPRRAVSSALEQAMTEQRVVRIRYTSADGTSTSRDVEPVVFASTGGRWHLIGWCRMRDAMRWFTVARIEQARVTAIACTGHTVEEIGVPPASARPVHGRDG